MKPAARHDRGVCSVCLGSGAEGPFPSHNQLKRSSPCPSLVILSQTTVFFPHTNDMKCSCIQIEAKKCSSFQIFQTSHSSKPAASLSRLLLGAAGDDAATRHPVGRRTIVNEGRFLSSYRNTWEWEVGWCVISVCRQALMVWVGACSA